MTDYSDEQIEAHIRECRSFLFYAATVKEGCEPPSPEWCEQASTALNEAAAMLASLQRRNANLAAEVRGHVAAAELADKNGITCFRNALAAASPCCAEKRRFASENASLLKAKREVAEPTEAEIEAFFERYAADVRYEPAEHPRMIYLIGSALKAFVRSRNAAYATSQPQENT